MGGLGSGRTFGTDFTSDYRSIDIRRWQRDGLLEPGQSFNWQWSSNGESIGNINVEIEKGWVRLVYSAQERDREREKLNYPIKLQSTSCHYGGVRYWFTCPSIGCGRRVAILYGGKIFACRHCYRLAYPSQRETDNSRRIRKADKIREQLNWKPGILNGKGCKPKGMHWKTFQRLQTEHDIYVGQSLKALSVKLKTLLN